mgnify:CR=1 FL=1
MKLFFDAIRWLYKKAFVIAFACVVYVSVHAMWDFKHKFPNPLGSKLDLNFLLNERTKDLEDCWTKASASYSKVLDLKQKIQELEQSKPNTFTFFPPTWNFAERSKIQLKIAALEVTKAAEEKARQSIVRRQRELEEQISGIKQQVAEIETSFPGKIVILIQKHWISGVLIGFGILVIPIATRTIWFYAVAPLASSAKPVRLARISQELGFATSPLLNCSESKRKFDLNVAPNESLFVRAACLQKTQGQTKKRTQIVWKPSAPFISYSARLWELIRVDGGREGASASIWSGKDADRQLVCVELRDHPGLVFRPRHLVGVIHEPDMLQLRKQWRLNYLHAWCTLQLRYIVLKGTGRVIFWAMGGIEAMSPNSGKDCVTQDSIAGFDTRLDYSVRRNETFYHYLRGREPLFDDCFEGEGQYLVSLASEKEGGIVGVDSWIERTLSIVGKVFGF